MLFICDLSLNCLLPLLLFIYFWRGAVNFNGTGHSRVPKVPPLLQGVWDRNCGGAGESQCAEGSSWGKDFPRS